MASSTTSTRPLASFAYAIPRHSATSAPTFQPIPTRPSCSFSTLLPRVRNPQLRERNLSRISLFSSFTSCGLQTLSKDWSLIRSRGDRLQDSRKFRRFGREGLRGRDLEGRGRRAVSMVHTTSDNEAVEIGPQPGSRPEMFSTEAYVPPAWASHLQPIPSSFTSLGIFPTPIHRWNLPGVPSGTEVWVKGHCRETIHAPIRVKFACPEAPRGGRGGKSEAAHLGSSLYGQNRERSRLLYQFLSSRCASLSVFLTRRMASSKTGAESEQLQEVSTSPSDPEESVVGGKYCVLLTGYASDYTENLYGGYGQMFIKLLADPYEKWDIYAVVDGQFPREEELEKYDGFVITGSRHDAHGSEDWIAKLCVLLQSLHEKKLKTLGVCFGHQVLSRALGGRTGKADVGWEIGLREVQTTTALASKPYAVGVPPVFRVLEVHQDQVQEIPPGGDLLGFSERTGIEVFGVGDHALGIQGHPEFTEDVVKDLIDTRHSSGILTEDEAKAARATLEAGQADREALVQLCKGFLKRKS